MPPEEYFYRISKEILHLKDTMLAEALLWEQNPDRYVTAQYKFPKMPAKYMVENVAKTKKRSIRQVRDKLKVIGRI